MYKKNISQLYKTNVDFIPIDLLIPVYTSNDNSDYLA